MAKKVSPTTSNKKAGLPKKKVKSGCRTCKIRRVKCDEGRPSCRRCVSTGRPCEGYGIWGGGGNGYGDRAVSQGHYSPVIRYPRSPAPLGVAAQQEREYYGWFMCLGAQKIQGIFSSDFWTVLIFQAGSADPAVFHASLALASVFKNADPTFDNPLQVRTTAERQWEEFTQQQYGKAIKHLQTHFSLRDSLSIRLVLIACILFTYTEFFCGRYESGTVHLKNGLRLLHEFQRQSQDMGEQRLMEHVGPDSSVDYLISATFARLHIHSALFEQASPGDYPGPLRTLPTSSTLRFGSLFQAKDCLDALLLETIHLTEVSFQPQSDQQLPEHHRSLEADKQRIQKGLAMWHIAFEDLMAGLNPKENLVHSFGSSLLHVYYCMTQIMIDTCLTSEGESAYDHHTDRFSMLTENVSHLYKIAHSVPMMKALPGHATNVKKAVCDVGPVPLLFFTALKCRVRKIRLQAINILKSSSHTEGIWNSQMFGCAAQEVMRLEEGNFDGGSEPIPQVPESNRISRVRVSFPSDSVSHKLRLDCWRRRLDGGYDVFSRDYDATEQVWRDGESTS
ncbi:hypothetical protein BX600DRAFT_505378 [Xylariales sp. PMI_506]|nr:hypothetical protein BX600DRAFT_505378 [Xylariales sp. PMI_506]